MTWGINQNRALASIACEARARVCARSWACLRVHVCVYVCVCVCVCTRVRARKFYCVPSISSSWPIYTCLLCQNRQWRLEFITPQRPAAKGTP